MIERIHLASEFKDFIYIKYINNMAELQIQRFEYLTNYLIMSIIWTHSFPLE